jgi:membrane-bound lytic murein transglycosylase MltF
MIKILYLLCLVIQFYIINVDTYASTNSEGKLKIHLNKVEFGDLDNIISKKYLRVLTTKNPYDYYIYQGRAKGIQYEMVKEFTKYLNKKYIRDGELKIAFELIPVDFDQLIPMLKAGKGDLIAVGLTKTPERSKLIDFTVPYQKVNDVIITRKELAKQDWKGKTFHVQQDSSYNSYLKSQGKLVNIEEVDSNFNAADLIELISLKKYDYTLVNSYWAKTLSKKFENLTIIRNKSFRKKVQISWAVRKNTSSLLSELNTFLPKVKKGSYLGNLLNYKYFYDIGKIKSRDFDIKTSTLSKFDKEIKVFATKFKFDWRLLAALCYQESRFNPKIINKWGAIGLFQIKQMTANEPYISIKEISGEVNYKNNIHAGVKYLAWIKDRYFDSNPEMSEQARLRMMLAAYNAGPRRVLQAINKAKEMGLDPNRWFRHVELAMLKLGYPEPVVYVSEINKRYVSYDLLGVKL